MRISLFVPCLVDAYYPRSAIAVVKVLEHWGHRVEFPKAQTCCGQPMWNNGFHDEVRPLVQRMIELFDPAEYVVTPSGSCAAMVREHFASAFEDQSAWRERAEALAGKTYEFVEFLDKVLRVDLAEYGVRWQGGATYHYSCHLRGLGVTDEATKLMQQVEGLSYSPLEKADQCCGFGGTFAVKYPDVSGELARDKAACIEATGSDYVVCNEAGCAMNLEGACRREGVGVRFVSLAEVIAEGLGLLERGDE